MELGYRPNAVAQSLVRGRTGVIGVFYGFPQVRSMFYLELVAAIQDACALIGRDVLIHAGHSVHGGQTVAQAYDGRVDGLILAAWPHAKDTAPFIEGGLPVVAIVEEHERIPSVTVDYELGGRLQARHLFDRGHRKVLYRGPRDQEPSPYIRERSFREEAALLGIEVVSGRRIGYRWEFELTHEETELVKSRSVTALACWEDELAHGTAAAVADLGMRVPEDVAVIGFNGSPTYFTPRFDVTTVDAHWDQVARAGVETLDRLLNGMPVAPRLLLPLSIRQGVTT